MISRPLLATRADQRRFVDRAPETKRMIDALTASRNVLLVGEAGSGRSSLLNHVAWSLERNQDMDAIVMGGDAVGDPAQLLGVLVARVRRLDGSRGRGEWIQDLRALSMPDGPFGQVVRPAVLMELIDLLAETVAERERSLCLMIDGLAPGVAHAVFGSLRDELWAVEGASWVLAGDTADASLYRQPPADAFFPVTIEVQPLSDTEARRLLKAHGQTPGPEQLREILAAGAGSPRRLLRAAADVEAGLLPAHARGREQAQRAAVVAGPLAGRLVEYLVDHGPVSASDPKLLRQVGASRQRVSELMHQLEGADLLQSTEQHRSGRPGRPTRSFALKGIP